MLEQPGANQSRMPAVLNSLARTYSELGHWMDGEHPAGVGVLANHEARLDSGYNLVGIEYALPHGPGQSDMIECASDVGRQEIEKLRDCGVCVH